MTTLAAVPQLVLGKLEGKQILNLTWKIEYYGTLEAEKKMGDYVLSPVFDEIWYMMLYPKGNCIDNTDYLAIFLCNNRDESVDASYAINIVQRNGEKLPILNWKSNKFEKKGHPASGWGFCHAIKRSTLVDPAVGHIVGGTLTILCEISTDDDREMLRDVKKDFRKFETLLKEQLFCDITLRVDGRKIDAHRSILSAKSSVFHVILEGDHKDRKMETVEVLYMKYDVCLEMLRYMYAGKVNDIGAIAQELYEAASRYAVDGLKKKCKAALISTLDNENVLDRIQFAITLEEDDLQKRGMISGMIKYIKRNSVEIMKMAKFQQFMNENHDLSVEIARAMEIDDDEAAAAGTSFC